MSFGISNNVRSREVRTCTRELFLKAVRSDYVARVCAGIADAWEQWKRGELAREEYDTVKNREKRRLPIFTFHATFPGGRRLNADAVPTGLSMYDIDHLDAPREYFAHVVEERAGELGIVLAHVTPSMEGLRLVFRIPAGLSLEEAQHWMSVQLDDPNYDQSVKDLARCSFAVPEDYILYMDEEGLFNFNEERKMKTIPQCKQSKDVLSEANEELAASNENSSFCPEGTILHSSFPEGSSLKFKGIPYSEIIRQWFALAGGEPAPGERNTKLHRLAYHLRHITDNDEGLLLKIMPRYGLTEEEMKSLIHSACTAAWCGMPRMMKEALAPLTPPVGGLPIQWRYPKAPPPGELRGFLRRCPPSCPR